MRESGRLLLSAVATWGPIVRTVLGVRQGKGKLSVIEVRMANIVSRPELGTEQSQNPKS